MKCKPNGQSTINVGYKKSEENWPTNGNKRAREVEVPKEVNFNLFDRNKRSIFSIGSWNIQGGVKNMLDLDILMKDLVVRKLDIACLQETRITEDSFLIVNRPAYGWLLNCGQETSTDKNHQYGMGFYVSNKMYNFYIGHKMISNRIAYIQFEIPTKQKNINNNGKKRKLENQTKYIEKNKIITIINIYAPTSPVAEKNPEEEDKFYEQLTKTYNNCKNKSSLVLIAGDFNAKLGTKNQTENEAFIGNFGKGTRNHKGHRLAEFLNNNDLYAANTHFKHPMRHRSTWHGLVKNSTGHFIQLHNQIDYVLIPSRMRQTLKNGRSYSGHSFNSDHSIVVVTINHYYKSIHTKSMKKRQNTINIDISTLTTNKKLQENYTSELKNNLNKISETESIENRVEHILEAIKKSAANIIPAKSKESIKGKINYVTDTQLRQWSAERKKLSFEIFNCMSNIEKTHKLRTQRNILKRLMLKKIWQIRTEKIEQLLTKLENTSEISRKFEITKALARSRWKPFRLQKDDGSITCSPRECEKILRKYYSNFFNPNTLSDTNIDSWGEFHGPLENPITENQVKAAQSKLRNHRASGDDGTQPELYKYGIDATTPALTKLYNDIFILEEHPRLLGAGYLIPVNKPGKSPEAKNLRALVLLTQLRKILSLIVLERIYENVIKYLPASQCAYRKGRCTTEITWAYEWLNAISYRYKRELYILGIDMSKAFDTIMRNKALDFFLSIVSTSDYRIIRVLLTNTSLAIIIAGYIGEWFNTFIGSAQGDGLSPIVWTVYLEGVMRPIRVTCAAIESELALQRSQRRLAKPIIETIYADDLDFIHYDLEALKRLYETLQTELPKSNLKLNPAKTEWTTISPGQPFILKKLGVNCDPEKDLNNRIQKASEAFFIYYKILTAKKPVSLKQRMRLYNVIICPLLLYDSGNIPYKESQIVRLEKFHRRQLRQVACIRWPQHISNHKLYQLCNTHSLRVDITRRRWNFTLLWLLCTTPNFK